MKRAKAASRAPKLWRDSGIAAWRRAIVSKSSASFPVSSRIVSLGAPTATRRGHGLGVCLRPLSRMLIALRLGCLVEHPERRPHMPHFAADDVAHDRGHFGNGEEFGRVGRLLWRRGELDRARHRNAGDIVDRGRGVTALSRDWQRKDAEMRRERHHLHIGAVSEETGIDDGVRDARKRGEHPIDKPKLARHKRRVVGPSEPLRKPDDLFEAGLTGSGRKRRRALDHEGMIGGQ